MTFTITCPIIPDATLHGVYRIWPTVQNNCERCKCASLRVSGLVYIHLSSNYSCVYKVLLEWHAAVAAKQARGGVRGNALLVY